jgi:hypothetical protein
MSTRISRSDFLKGFGCVAVAAAGGAYWQWHNASPKFPCRMLGPSRDFGHQLRGLDTGARETPFAQVKAPAGAVIIGGGIAGLSAAWWLKRNNFADFAILELESAVGGNSTSGKNEFSAFPWGAHYVPCANSESEYVKELFRELGVITSTDAKSGLPIYDERYLCHEPQERLFKDGIFQDGLVPRRGLQKDELDELGRFFDVVSELRKAVGADGRLAFAIPLDLSSQDPKFTNLDRISMAEWLRNNSFVTKPLHWYINYCCRDDYGSTADNVSAWAGVHYFAGRRGVAANAELNSVITWPEGNGFLVGKLRDLLKDHIHTGCLVKQVKNQNDQLQVVYTARDSAADFGFLCDRAIFCAPRFIAKHVIDSGSTLAGTDLQYAPWLVANITVRAVPAQRGVPIAWDNVSYYSKSLGYVLANHQDITTRERPVVLTYYNALSELSPKESRTSLYQASPAELSSKIVADLVAMHPGIGSEIQSMDIWPWGHGMIRPSVGFIWSDTRTKMKDECGNILFAHSDMSGMSNFEEAQYHGIEAAKRLLEVVPQAYSDQHQLRGSTQNVHSKTG